MQAVTAGTIDKWIGFFKTIIERDYDELEKPAETQEDIESKEKDLITDLLGAVCQASYRIFQKFGNRKVFKKDPSFPIYYCENLAQQCMEAHLYIISKKDKFVGRKALYFSLRYIEFFVNNNDTSPMLHDHMQKLLHEYLVPLVSISISDGIEFDQNPHESMRKELSSDPQSSDNCPKIAAKSLIEALCKYKVNKSEQPVLLNDFLHFCIGNLNESKSNPDLDFRVKDATIYSLYAITPIIIEYDHLCDGLEVMMTEHILPDIIKGDHKFLKSRAMLYYYAITKKMMLEDESAAYEYCQGLYENIMREDECINIKVYAL